MNNVDKLKFRIEVYERMINNNFNYIAKLKNQIRELKNTTNRQKKEIKELEEIIIDFNEEIEK